MASWPPPVARGFRNRRGPDYARALPPNVDDAWDPVAQGVIFTLEDLQDAVQSPGFRRWLRGVYDSPQYQNGAEAFVHYLTASRETLYGSE